MAGPILTVIPTILEGAAARKTGKEILFTVGETVIFQIAIDKAREYLETKDFGSLTTGILTNTLDRVPNAIKDGINEETLKQELANWIIDTMNEVVRGTIDEVVDTFNGDLVLNFGRDSFSTKEKVARPRYDFAAATAALVMNDDEDHWVPVTAPLALDGETNDAALYFDTGLTVIIAGSGVGKTTFCRNLVTYLLNLEGKDNVAVNYLSWNEREYYSSGGSPANLVERIDEGTNSADVFLLDSVRDFTLGGSGAAGYRGMNTEFFVQLTQWHHAFRERNVCGFVIVNPIIQDTDFIEILEEVIRGSVNGFLHIKRRGEGVYEHVRTGRKPVKVRLPENGWSGPYRGIVNPIEGPETVVLESSGVNVNNFKSEKDYFTE